ncbi:MAG: hypothetical protein ACOVP1_14715 [Bacteroidia bacterium]
MPFIEDDLIVLGIVKSYAEKDVESIIEIGNYENNPEPFKIGVAVSNNTTTKSLGY